MDTDLSKEHYAAIIHDSIYHEGDERSRTHPGHGYPAYTESIIKYKPFKDKAEMESWVKSARAFHLQQKEISDYTCKTNASC